jgi:vanillate O-demethylase monooxygenase subunit
MAAPRSSAARIKRFADSTTPLVRSEWYVAAGSAEVSETPLARRVCGVDMALVRRPNGAVAILADRCPHRGYPMHLGTVEGDAITCGYHGIRFGLDGKCLAVPSQDRPPKGIALGVYPAVERGGWIWVWPAGERPPSGRSPPETPWLDDPAWTTLRGRVAAGANYIGLHENLIDLSSFSYLLRESVGAAGYAQAPFVLRTDARRVHVERALSGVRLPPFYASILGDRGAVDRRTLSTFESPGFQIAHSEIRFPDGRICRTKILHAITPADANATHYFWAVARDFAVDDSAASARQRDVAEPLFAKIARSLEAIAAAAPGGDANDVHLSTDQAGLELRHIIQTRAHAES